MSQLEDLNKAIADADASADAIDHSLNALASRPAPVPVTVETDLSEPLAAMQAHGQKLADLATKAAQL